MTYGCKGSGSETSIAAANGKPITQGEWDAYVKLKQLRVEDPARKTRALDEYAATTGLAGEIEAEKLVDQQQIQAEVNEYRKQLIINRYFEKFLQDKVTQKQLIDYYNSHPAEFEEQNIHVAQILFRITPGMTEAERKAKLEAAQAAYKQVHEGKDFAAVASSISEDVSSRRNGGDMGRIRPNGVNPMFSKRAFELKAGEISEPFQTPLGYHIVKVLEPAQTIKKPFTLSQASIRNQLLAQAREAESARLVAKAKVEVEGKPREAPQEVAASAATDKPVAAR